MRDKVLRYLGTLGIFDGQEGHIFSFYFMKDNMWCTKKDKLDKFVHVWHQ